MFNINLEGIVSIHNFKVILILLITAICIFFLIIAKCIWLLKAREPLQFNLRKLNKLLGFANKLLLILLFLLLLLLLLLLINLRVLSLRKIAFIDTPRLYYTLFTVELIQTALRNKLFQTTFFFFRQQSFDVFLTFHDIKSLFLLVESALTRLIDQTHRKLRTFIKFRNYLNALLVIIQAARQVGCYCQTQACTTHCVVA